MIIISPNFVLNEQAGITSNNPIILWDSVLTSTNLTASATADADYPVTNLLNPATDIPWVSATVDDQYLTLDAAGLGELDTVGIARHNFYSGNVQVSLELNTGSGYSEDIPPFLPGDDDVLMMRFSPSSLTGLRVKLAPDLVEPEAAVMFVGRSLALQRRLYVGHTPITYGRRVTATVGMSEGGDYLGSIVTGISRESAIDLQNITPGWYRSSLDPFIRQCGAARQPFFFGWRPESYPDEVGYCWVTNDPQPVNQRTNGMMQISIRVNGIG